MRALGSPRPGAVDVAAITIACLKNGSSSAIDPSLRGLPPPRDSTSSRPTTPVEIAACSSRSAENTSSRPSTVRTTQRSGPVEGTGRNTRNCAPQFVHFTVVPRSDTKASSKSYSVPQRSQVTSMKPIGEGAARERRPFEGGWHEAGDA